MRLCPALLGVPLLALAWPAQAPPGQLSGRVDVDLPRGIIAILPDAPQSIEGLVPCIYERTTAAGRTRLERLYARTVKGII